MTVTSDAAHSADTAPAPTRLRTIVTYVDGEAASAARLDTAAALARTHGAHLSVLAIAHDPNIAAYGMTMAGATMADDFSGRAQAEVEARAREISERLQHEGVLFDVEAAVCTIPDVDIRLAECARYADLALVEPPYAPDAGSTAADALEAVLFRGDTPVLICPRSVEEIRTGAILVAWDGSDEALHAVNAAMGLLRAAGEVEIAMIGEDIEVAADARRLAAKLARHGVAVSLATHPADGRRTAEILLSRAKALQAGLLVMGAYSHSRLRERVLGGVTREVLELTTLPVLMAH
ncbi:MAG: universal stress protein [Pseudomonadota bacterium]